jgi:serine/threonine-protein kinase
MTPLDEPGEGRTVIASDAVEPAPAARRTPGMLAPGDLLNGIYRVDRLIARGGMGDVYQGVNVESDERVAIKAMRAHLAADPKVLTLFRREARVLTQFAHPAIVQYRVLAREPTLELYYLVMDFIDGEPLSSMLDGTRPSAAAVAGLGLRLASGLDIAHEHGAIHRDMSPDNVLLPDGRVERAKIIDFGIAKSLDVAAETVIGDGFAGKIGYVAPEQFGDFDRQVGPWTDVYSLGLVLLSYACGRSSDMGSTLAEAVERRRSGPNLDDVPPVLEPLFRRMLAANPADRIRSMAAVIAELEALELEDVDAPIPPTALLPPHDRWPSAATAAPTPTPLTTYIPVEDITPDQTAPELAAQEHIAVEPGPELRPTTVPPQPPPDEPQVRRRMRKWVPIAVAVAAVAALGGLALTLKPGAAPPKKDTPVALAAAAPQPAAKAASLPAPATPASTPATAPGPDAATPTGSVSQIPCAWLSTGDTGAPQVGGAAGDPDAMRSAAADRTTGRKVAADGLLRLNRAQCATVDAMRTFDTGHDAGPSPLTLAAAQVQMGADTPGCGPGPQAQAELTVTPATGDDRTFAVLALTPSGALRQLVSGREEFSRLASARPQLFTDLGGGKLKIRACLRQAGPTGLILVQGKAPLDLGLKTGASDLRPSAGFVDSFNSAAAAQGWTTRAVWLQVAPPAPAPASLTAQLNAAAARQPAAAAQAPAPQAPTLERTAVQSCRHYTGGAWQELGYATLTDCLQLAFRDSCNIASAQFGQTPLRHFNGQIQAQLQNGRWVKVARAICLSRPPSQTLPAQAGHRPSPLSRLWPWSSSRASPADQHQGVAGG